MAPIYNACMCYYLAKYEKFLSKSTMHAYFIDIQKLNYNYHNVNFKWVTVILSLNQHATLNNNYIIQWDQTYSSSLIKYCAYFRASSLTTTANTNWPFNTWCSAIVNNWELLKFLCFKNPFTATVLLFWIWYVFNLWIQILFSLKQSIFWYCSTHCHMKIFNMSIPTEMTL